MADQVVSEAGNHASEITAESQSAGLPDRVPRRRFTLVFTGLVVCAVIAFNWWPASDDVQSAASQRKAGLATSDSPVPPDALYLALSRLKSDTNTRFGYKDGHPRVNLGPCGTFAREFHDYWNERFENPVQIVFVTIAEGTICRHVLVQLPNGLYFDGGNGLMTERELRLMYMEVNGRADTTMSIVPMPQFDEKVFRANSLFPPYADCPNFTAAAARQLIEKHLSALDRSVL